MLPDFVFLTVNGVGACGVLQGQRSSQSSEQHEGAIHMRRQLRLGLSAAPATSDKPHSSAEDSARTREAKESAQILDEAGRPILPQGGSLCIYGSLCIHKVLQQQQKRGVWFSSIAPSMYRLQQSINCAANII